MNARVAWIPFAVALISSCRDLEGPRAHVLIAPSRVSRTLVGAPDTTFTIPADRGSPAIKTYMLQFPWDTYVTLEAIGTIYLNAKDKLPNAGPNYIWPSREVKATGQVDNHTDGVCALGLSMSDNYGPLPSFGVCGATPKIDTVLSLKIQTPWIMRGFLPVGHLYECSNTSMVCHYLDIGDRSYVREKPIPISLKLSVSPATLDTAQLSPHQFTGSISPDSITLNGNKSAHPYHVTLWQWIGADSTRDPVLTGAGKGPGCTITPQTLLCTYRPPEAGRMLLKVFVGGWEQTSTTTVQCLVSPGDSVLNNTATDFSLREALLDALARSNPDSAAGAGATAEHRGYRHEEGGRIYRWRVGPNAGKYFTSPVVDPNATECHTDVRRDEVNETYLGADLVGHYHTHPSIPPDSVYGCLGTSDTGEKYSQYPGDGLKPYYPGATDDNGMDNYGFGGGSISDWIIALSQPAGSSDYVIWKDGTVFRLSHGASIDRNPNFWSAFGAARDPAKPAGKCTWPKKYTPT